MLHMMQWPAAQPQVLQTIFLKIEYKFYWVRWVVMGIDRDWHSHHPLVRLATCKNTIRCIGLRKRIPFRMRSMRVHLHDIIILMRHPPSPVEWMNACLLSPHQWRCGQRWRRRKDTTPTTDFSFKLSRENHNMDTIWIQPLTWSKCGHIQSKVGYVIQFFLFLLFLFVFLRRTFHFFL